MPDYRRNRVEGGTYFFTLALADRRSDLLVREVAALRSAVVRTRRLHPFRVDAWVVLPEHMHAVWTLPEGDAAYSLRWALIKRWFSAAIPRGEDRSASRADKGERGLWQRRFWEHTVRDSEDFARHVDYVHFNPVKHGLVGSARDWPYSSFRRAVGQGKYPADWACPDEDGSGFGERDTAGEPGRNNAMVFQAREGGGVRKGTPPYVTGHAVAERRAGSQWDGYRKPGGERAPPIQVRRRDGDVVS